MRSSFQISSSFSFEIDCRITPVLQMSANRIGHVRRISRSFGQFFQPMKTHAIVEMQKSKLLKAAGRLYHSESRAMEQGNLRVMKRFDICLSSPMFPETMDKVMFNSSECSTLGPGMILLREYVPIDGQVEIVRECRRLGLGKGGFYHPRPGPNLHMMCLGLHWEPAMYKYVKERSFDGAKPPPIPHNFIELTSSAIAAANQFIDDEDMCGGGIPANTLPHMEPDICLVNFYETNRRLGIHQDKDESRQSLNKGLPVVSISLGDSAIFVYGYTRDLSKMHKVVLKSGDVLIFGGRSRLIFHGVESIIPSSAPLALKQATNLRPGRLALTFRKY